MQNNETIKLSSGLGILVAKKLRDKYGMDKWKDGSIIAFNFTKEELSKIKELNLKNPHKRDLVSIEYLPALETLSIEGTEYNEYIRKIPQNVLNIIANQRNMQYEKQIKKDQPLENQNLSKEAIALLASLKLEYWCETEQEKRALRNLLRLNDEKHAGIPLSTDIKSMDCYVKK